MGLSAAAVASRVSAPRVGRFRCCVAVLLLARRALLAGGLPMGGEASRPALGDFSGVVPPVAAPLLPQISICRSTVGVEGDLLEPGLLWVHSGGVMGAVGFLAAAGGLA